MEIINLCIELSYLETTWYKSIILGIESSTKPRKETIVFINQDDIASLEEGSVLIVVASTDSFVKDTISICLEHNIRPLIVGSNPNTSFGKRMSFVSIDRESAMFTNVNNLFNNGYQHIALIGANPSVYTDVSHTNGYRLACSRHGMTQCEQDIYYNTESIDNTISKFLENIKSYDAVVCTNDFVASYLLAKLHSLNIKVPEDIAVTGAGNSEISQYTNPPLTTIDIPLKQAGQYAVELYRILSCNNNIDYLNASLEFKIIYRESTVIKNKSIDHNVNPANDSYIPVFDKDYEASMKPIWNIANAFSSLDETDRRIISLILADKSNVSIASSVYISDSALSYRLNKIYSCVGVNGKEELKTLFKEYFPNYKSQ